MKSLNSMSRVELELEIVQRKVLFEQLDPEKLEHGKYTDDEYRQVIHEWQERQKLAGTDFKKEFKTKVQEISRRHHNWQVFSDFCEMATIAISNALIYNDELEQKYMSIVKRYNREEATKIAELLGVVTCALEWEMHDFLGDMFMSLELFNKWQGQFFTPYSICLLNAKIVANSEMFEKQKFVMMHEPACGSGAMIIALAQTLKDSKINYQQRLHVTAVDISNVAAYMTYIQLSLLYVPAIVHVGNTLSMEMRETWYTPAHIMGYWNGKLTEHRQ